MSRQSELDLGAPEGWIAFDHFAAQPTRSFVSGDPRGRRLRVRYFRRERDGAFMGKAWFGEECEGPPGHAHGGSLAAVIDEGMGVAAWVYGHPSVAAELTVKFLEMVPLGTVVQIDAFIVQVDGKKIVTAGGLIGNDGTIFCEGQGLFVKFDPSRFGELADHTQYAREGSFEPPRS